MGESWLQKQIRRERSARTQAQKDQNRAIRRAAPVTRALVEGRAKPAKKGVRRLTIAEYKAAPKIDHEQQGTNENRERWLYQAYLKQLDAEAKK